jgi:hypothetical protein
LIGFGYRHWTDREVEDLRRDYKLLGAQACAARLNRTVGAIKRKAWDLGLLDPVPTGLGDSGGFRTRGEDPSPEEIRERAERERARALEKKRRYGESQPQPSALMSRMGMHVHRRSRGARP